MSSEETLLEVLNKLIKVLDPIEFADLNIDLYAVDQEGLLALEQVYSAVGVKREDNDETKEFCSSTAALIATITDILVGKRLAFQVDDAGIIVGFQWYSED